MSHSQLKLDLLAPIIQSRYHSELVGKALLLKTPYTPVKTGEIKLA